MMVVFKALGFVKQTVIAYYYGATSETDTFFIASAFIMGVLDSLVKALTVATVAEYTRVRIQEGREKAQRIINGLTEVFLPFEVLLIAVFILAAPLISRILAPAYEAEDLAVLTMYIRILAPSFIFICTQFAMSAVLDSHKAFFVPRLETFIYSAFSIIACIFLSKKFGIDALIFAQFLSTLFLSVILLFAARKYHKFSFVNPKNTPELKTIVRNSVPLFVGYSVLQINEVVDKAITSGLGEGATSALHYGQSLEQFVTIVMVVNIGNVLLTDFAENVAKNEIGSVRDQLSKVTNFLISLLIGVSVITMICAKDIVIIVFYRGNFTMEAAESAAMALVGYAIAFAAVAVREMAARGLYAFQDPKKTMISSVVSITINIALSIVLSRFIGLFGIAIATSLSAFVGMIMNVSFLKKYIKDYPVRHHLISCLKCIPAAAVVAGLCFAVNKFVPAGSFVRFMICGFAGLAVYVLLLYALRITEVSEMIGRIVKKIRKQ